MESKVGKLEADVDHIKSRTNAIGTDIRELRSRVDVVHDSLSKKMDDGFQALSAKMDSMSRDISATKVWALLIAAAVLGVTAHALKWL
jgi:outer membrane murein-binding lipoprotein Lpp